MRWSVLLGGVRYDCSVSIFLWFCYGFVFRGYIVATIDQIVSDIIELSLERPSNDEVRNIYSVYMIACREVGKVMKSIREGERCRTTKPN